MFELSWGEIALIGIVALIVIGPKELPGLLRGMGQALAKLRRMASDFQYQFNQALQEAEVDKVKSSISSVTDGINTPSTFNPIDYARDQIKSAVDDVKGTGATDPAAIGPPPPDPLATAIPAPPSYSVDPATIQKAFAPTEPPPGFAGAVRTPDVAAAAAPADVAPALAPVADTPVAEAPAPEPAKPKRSRKAAEEAPAASPETTAEGTGDDAPKRARKTRA
jgi:sec-independent protein translocase protein TatB